MQVIDLLVQKNPSEDVRIFYVKTLNLRKQYKNSGRWGP